MAGSQNPGGGQRKEQGGQKDGVPGGQGQQGGAGGNDRQQNQQGGSGVQQGDNNDHGKGSDANKSGNR
jgi:hypothetical protein